MARLKVFTTTSGFYDLAVAVSSQPKALEAWGIRQNLFAEGMARVATDGATVRAALAKPGIVLRRPLGAKKPFSEEPSLPKVRGGKRRFKARKVKSAKAIAAEKRAQATEKKHARKLASLEREREALEAKIAAERAVLQKS